MQATTRQLPFRGMKKTSRAFTLIEILLSVVIASVVIVILLTFFGDAFQKFVQHEDSISSEHEMQKLMEYLRKDIEIARPGVSQDLTSTYPQEVLHIYHSSKSDKLIKFAWKKEQPGESFHATDPIRQNLPPSNRQIALLNRYTALSGAGSYHVDKSKGSSEHIYRFTLLIQPDDVVQYTFNEKLATLVREHNGKEISFAPGSVKIFTVRPVFDFYHEPSDPEFLVVLNKLMYEIQVQFQSEQNGGKITKRKNTFATFACPWILNNQVRSRWNN